MSYYLELADWHYRRAKLKARRRIGAKLTFKAMTFTSKLARNADGVDATLDRVDLVIAKVPSKRVREIWFGPA